MRKLGIFVLILGIVLLVVGGGITALAYKDGAFKQETKTESFESTDDFDDIYVDLSISDVEIKKADDNKLKVVLKETEKFKHQVKIENNKLNITNIDERPWYNKWLFSWFMELKVTIFLPKDTYNELNVKMSTGNFTSTEILTFDNVNTKMTTGNTHLSNIRANEFNSKSSTGNLLLSEIKATNLYAEASTGNIALVNVLVDNKMTAKASTGNIKFDSSDAKNIEATVSTGNIYGNFLTAKSFNATSSTGNVNVPNTTGDPCVLKTSTGNINITIKE